MYQFLWIFFVYAFLGWCTEVCYAALVSGRFVNRGFLNGPVCPIYGFGVVLLLACLSPLRSNLLLLFLGSVLLTSALEWLTGFVLEKLFHQRWWDYSDQPFNLGGYICLRFSIAWGLACLFVTEILHPSIAFFIRHIPVTLGWVLLGIFAAVMAVDLAATVRTIAKINRRLSQIDELASKIRDASNEFGESLADKVLEAAERGSDWREEMEGRREELGESLSRRRAELREEMADRREEMAQRRQALSNELEAFRARLQELMDERNFGQRRLLRAFPRMRSTTHRQALERLRRRMEIRREQKGK